MAWAADAVEKHIPYGNDRKKSKSANGSESASQPRAETFGGVEKPKLGILHFRPT